MLQVALLLTLSLVGKMCGARTEALPDRDLKTYLPDAVSTKYLEVDVTYSDSSTI